YPVTVSSPSVLLGPHWATRGMSLAIAAALLVGCATSGWRVPPPPAGATKADLDWCEPVAQAASQKATRRGGGGGGLGALGVVTVDPRAIVFLPFLAVGTGFSNAIKDAKPAWHAYELAMVTCLAPALLERKLGPDHPDVANAYRGAAELFAAINYAQAALAASERAVAIDERA